MSIISNGINFHYKETRRELAVPVEVLCGFQALFRETKNKRFLLGTTPFRLSVQLSARDVVSPIISSNFHKIWYRRSLQKKFGTGDLYKNLVQAIFKKFGTGDLYKNLVQAIFTKIWYMRSLQKFGTGDLYKNLVQAIFTKIWYRQSLQKFVQQA